MSMSFITPKRICIYLSSFIMLVLPGCNKKANTKIVNNSLENKNYSDSFNYEIKIYNAMGRVSVYRLTSSKPLTKLDSSIFMEESLKDERKNMNP